MRNFHHRIPIRRKLPIGVCHKNTDQWLSYIEQSSCKAAAFMFYIVDTDTGYGLHGAEFALMKNEEIIFESYSNRSGAVWFPLLKEGTYTLKELSYPEQYIPEKYKFSVHIHYNGNITIDGMPVCRFKIQHKLQKETASFTIIIYDVRSGIRLDGAVFTLCQNEKILGTEVSDKDGLIKFHNLSSGIYNLVEQQPPAGYIKNSASHVVVVANDGTVTIDGHAAEQASIGNKPILYDIFFVKQDEQTGEPLQGAVFELLEDSVVLYTAVSNEKGEINFGSFAPGTYLLREQKPPAGYLTNTHAYTVVVAQDGKVTIDGIPTERATIGDKRKGDVITVRMLNANQETMSGVVFQLLQEEMVVQEVCADGNGEAIYMNLQAGDYKIVQLGEEGKPMETTHMLHVSNIGVITIDDRETDELIW